MLFRIRNLTTTRKITWIMIAITCVFSAPPIVRAQDDELRLPPDRVSVQGTESPIDWWHGEVTQTVLDTPRWVTFDLETVLLDTLGNSPRISSVSRRTSVVMEKIIQQDAAFDSAVLFESNLGRTNDPVGNSLITGGPPRLIEESLTTRAGIQKTGRRGTTIDLSQELGLLNSNSNSLFRASRAMRA